MNIVLCADRRVLPGLHVSAYSLLDRISPDVEKTRFHVFSDELEESDIKLLTRTLASIRKPFSVELRRIDPKQFNGYPSLNGSWATYYRLAVPEALEVERFLYIDVDTLCDRDVSDLNQIEMGSSPAALVPEAPLSGAADRYVAEQLGNSPTEPYFNAGVILINRQEWLNQRISLLALDYLQKNPAHFWDQSALNVVLRSKVVVLDERYNTISNMRMHWPNLRRGLGKMECLLHFVDYPKPWDLGAEFIHPHYRLWRSVLEKTAMRDFRSWHDTPTRRLPTTAKAKTGYKKAIKDRLLFTGYTKGWIRNVKGTTTTSY
ncbi:MAG: glycosyltransferase family 8 protein [Proteobacteria bacterium]|nr:glycosyltransferase family 8 protein [Pseudomonadota bacterium]